MDLRNKGLFHENFICYKTTLLPKGKNDNQIESFSHDEVLYSEIVHVHNCIC